MERAGHPKIRKPPTDPRRTPTPTLSQSLLLLHACRHRQVRNHYRRTLGIAVHRPYLFQLRLRRCTLDKFSCFTPHVTLLRFPQREGAMVRSGQILCLALSARRQPSDPMWRGTPVLQPLESRRCRANRQLI